MLHDAKFLHSRTTMQSLRAACSRRNAKTGKILEKSSNELVFSKSRTAKKFCFFYQNDVYTT